MGEEAEDEVSRGMIYDMVRDYDDWCEFCGDERPCECDSQLSDDYGQDYEY